MINKFDKLYDSLYLEFLAPLGAAATGGPGAGSILTLSPPKHHPKKKKRNKKSKKDRNDQDWGNINFEGKKKKKEPKVRKGKLGTGTTGPDTGTRVHKPKKGKGSYNRHEKHESGISVT